MYRRGHRQLVAVVLLVLIAGCQSEPSSSGPAGRAAATPSASPSATPQITSPGPPPPRPTPAPAPAPVTAPALPAAPPITQHFAGHTVVSALAGLPPDGLSRLAADPAVAGLVVARTGDLAVHSGLPTHPEIPVEAVAADAEAFGQASDEPTLAALLSAGAVLSRTSAALRGVDAGGTLTLVGGRTVPVTGVVDDAAIGGYEVAVDADLGQALGLTSVGYVLLRGAEGATTDQLAGAARRALSGRTLRIRPPGERPFARRGDEVLPQALLKSLFGEFAVRRTGGGLVQDPAWAQQHLVEADVPLLGSFRCHRVLLAALVPAMQEVVDRGLTSTVFAGQFAGCHSVRAVRGGASLSRHAWGAAVDLNGASNPLGAVPRIDPRLVEVLESHGLRWGGRFLRPDGQHFEGYGITD